MLGGKAQSKKPPKGTSLTSWQNLPLFKAEADFVNGLFLPVIFDHRFLFPLLRGGIRADLNKTNVYGLLYAQGFSVGYGRLLGWL